MTRDKDQPVDNVVPLRPVPLRTNEQLDADVNGLLNTLKGELSHEDALDTILRLQAIWDQLRPEVQATVKRLVCDRLMLEGKRFDFAMRAHHTRDIIRVLYPIEVPKLKFTADEIFYLQFPGWINDYLRWCMHDETPLIFQFWSGMAALATCMRRSYWMIGKSEPLYPNIYMLLVGPAGCGKTTAINIATKMVKKVNNTLIERAIASGRSPEDEPFIHILMDRLTPVSFVEKLKAHRRRFVPPSAAQEEDMFETCALLVASELSTMLGDERWAISDLISLFTRAYDGELHESTGNRGDITIPNLVLTMILGSTVESLREIVTPTTFRSGFMGARCLAFQSSGSERRLPDVIPRDPMEEERLTNFLVECATARSTEMRWTTEARQSYADWYANFDRIGYDSRITGYFSRKQLQVRKIAMMLAVGQGHQPWITLQDFEMARLLLEHEEPKMFATFVGMLKGVHTDLVEYAQRYLSKGPQQRTNLYQRLYRQCGNGKVAKDVLTTLREAGMIEEFVPENLPKRGPKRIMVRWKQPEVEQESGGEGD